MRIKTDETITIKHGLPLEKIPSLVFSVMENNTHHRTPKPFCFFHFNFLMLKLCNNIISILEQKAVFEAVFMVCCLFSVFPFSLFLYFSFF